MTVIIHCYQENIAFFKLGGPWGWLRIWIGVLWSIKAEHACLR